MTYLTIKLENECIQSFLTQRYSIVKQIACFISLQCFKDYLIFCGGSFEAPGRDMSFYKFVALKKRLFSQRELYQLVYGPKEAEVSFRRN